MGPVTTRDRIVDSAIELFRRRGFRGTSLKDLSSAGEVTIGSIYHAFPGGKDELGGAAVHRAGAAYQELIELILDDHADLADGVRSAFDGAADVLVETDFVDLCPIATIAAEVASSNEPLRMATAEVFEQWRIALRRRLTAAGVAVARDADDLADAVVAAMEGSFVMARAARDPEPVRRAGRVLAAAIAARTG